MNRLTINLDVLQNNIQKIDALMQKHGATWTLVTKVLCGHADSLRALQSIGVRSMGDSRLGNLEAIERIVPDFDAWYLRLPHNTAIERIVRLSDVSLNSELETIELLEEEAKRQNKIHRIIIMIELGDLREGILPGALVEYYQRVFEMSHVECIGIGANLGCISGLVPNIDQLTQLVMYHELLNLKFHRSLPLISAGSSVILPLLLEGQVPRGINHFRIGEAVFLGSDLINGGTLPGLRNDAITLEAEIVEIKEKSLVPTGLTSSTVSPFEELEGTERLIGQRGYRAIVTLGHLDTIISGLTPLNENYHIAGASSDLTVVNIGDEPGILKIGDTITFRLNYSAMLHAMVGKYIDKMVAPPIGEFRDDMKQSDRIEIPPIMEHKDSQNAKGSV